MFKTLLNKTKEMKKGLFSNKNLKNLAFWQISKYNMARVKKN